MLVTTEVEAEAQELRGQLTEASLSREALESEMLKMSEEAELMLRTIESHAANGKAQSNVPTTRRELHLPSAAAGAML